MTNMAARASDLDDQEVIARTRRWLEVAVLGLNLCPFARLPYREQRIRFRVSQARERTELLLDLESELDHLTQTAESLCETSLLVCPQMLADFRDFNDFLGEAEDCLHRLDLVGVLQIASFHPDYQFADSAVDDIENCTNRAPFPTLHLLRESSVAAAVASVQDTDAIYRRNMATLRSLGKDGWAALWQAPDPPPLSRDD